METNTTWETQLPTTFQQQHNLQHYLGRSNEEEQPQQQPQQKLPLKLDWDSLPDDAPTPLVVKSSDDAPPPCVDGLDRLTVFQLEDNIRKKRKFLECIGKNIPDRGAKLRATVKAYEDEVTRRKFNRRPQKVDEELKQPRQATSARGVVSCGMSSVLVAERRKIREAMKAAEGSTSVIHKPVSSGRKHDREGRCEVLPHDLTGESPAKHAHIGDNRPPTPHRKPTNAASLQTVLPENSNWPIAFGMESKSSEVSSLWDSRYNFGKLGDELFNPADQERFDKVGVAGALQAIQAYGAFATALARQAEKAMCAADASNLQALINRAEKAEVNARRTSVIAQKYRFDKDKLAEEHEEAMSQLKKDHELALVSLKEKLQAEHNETVSKLEADHENSLKVAMVKGYDYGWHNAMDQFCCIYGKADLTRLDRDKVVVDGVLVDLDPQVDEEDPEQTTSQEARSA